MKIILVATGLGMGGAEHVVVNLADFFASHGHEVIITYLTGRAIIVPSHPSVKTIPLEMNSKMDLIKAYLRLRRVVLTFKPDVMHSHMIHANILARLVRLTVKIPRLICTAHSNNEGGKLRMLAYRLTDHLADISTNVSDDAVRAFIAKGAVKAGRMISVPNGIDVNKFGFDPIARENIRAELKIADKHMLLSVGRLDEAKDYPNFLTAVSILKKERQDFTAYIAGEGPLKSNLEIIVRELKLEDNVIFLGLRRDISALMSAADLFVLSSSWEGLPLVVGEAMACGRVIVATDCGGVKQILGSTGRLVDAQDSNALANEIRNTLAFSPEKKSILGKQARKRVAEMFSIEATAAKYIRLYL